MIGGLRRGNERGVRITGGKFWGKLDCWIYCEGGGLLRKHMDQILGEGEGEDELWTNNSDLGYCSLEEPTETFLAVYVLYNGRSSQARVRS